MDELTLTLSQRSLTGKKVKNLRSNGIVPVHLFGKGTSSQSLQVEIGVLRRVLLKAGGNVPVKVDVEKQEGENVCFIREIQWHPVTEDLLHVDFQKVDITEMVTAAVPLVLEGVAPAVEILGGTLIQSLDSVDVESLPMDMPVLFNVDVSGLDNFDKTIRVNVLEAGPNVTVVTDLEDLIATVVPPRIEEEEEPEGVEGLEDGEEMGEGAEVGEGGMIESEEE